MTKYSNPPFLPEFGAPPPGAGPCTGTERGAAVRGDPTGLPWLTLDLPCPPSVNRFMGKLGNRSPVVRRWVKDADCVFMQWTSNPRHRPGTKIIGSYEAEFIFLRHKGDLSNRTKALEDWLQRVEMIQNDKFCERLLLTWGDAPLGVRVRLRPWVTAS